MGYFTYTQDDQDVLAAYGMQQAVIEAQKRFQDIHQDIYPLLSDEEKLQNIQFKINRIREGCLVKFIEDSSKSSLELEKEQIQLKQPLSKHHSDLRRLGFYLGIKGLELKILKFSAKPIVRQTPGREGNSEDHYFKLNHSPLRVPIVDLYLLSDSLDGLLIGNQRLKKTVSVSEQNYASVLKNLQKLMLGNNPAVYNQNIGVHTTYTTGTTTTPNTTATKYYTSGLATPKWGHKVK